MLLIEADPAAWRSDPKAAINRLVALRVGKRTKADYMWAYARRGVGEGELTFEGIGVNRPSGRRSPTRSGRGKAGRSSWRTPG